MNYTTKADFYNMVSNLRRNWGYSNDCYGIDFVELCRQQGIKIGTMPFDTPGLRGIASLGGPQEKDVIILNTLRNSSEQNIDCAHETVHINFHKNKGCQSFNCFDKTQPNQNRYLEWQANEGSAELVVPYRSLLPKVNRNKKFLNTYTNISHFKEELVHDFGVTDAVISYRLESLKYEIEQYINGTPMSDIKILSLSAQKRLGINVKSLNAIAFEDLSSDYEAMFDLAGPEWIAHILPHDWKNILNNLGGVIRASLCDTTLETKGDNCFCIVFKDYSNYLIGSRLSIIDELERYVLVKYKETVNFSAQLGDNSCFYIKDQGCKFI